MFRAGTATAAVWYPLDPPRAGETNVLDTLLMGDCSWVAYASTGLAKYDEQFQAALASFPITGLETLAGNNQQEMFPSPVTDIVVDDDRICVGTQRDGLYIFDGSSWRRWATRADGLLHPQVNCLALYRKFLFIGTEDGLNIMAPDGTMTEFVPTRDTNHGTPRLESNRVQCLLWDDTEGDMDKLVLWIGIYRGLLRLSLPGGAMEHGCRAVPVDARFPAWPVPTSEAVFKCYVWPGNSHCSFTDFCPFDPSLCGENVYDMVTDDLNLYVATDNGITRVRK